MNTSLQLLIVGAGPTGLALACWCARLGVRLRIIDKCAQGSRRSKAIGLQFRASELLACMGIEDRFRKYPDAPRAAQIYGARPLTLALPTLERSEGADAFSPRAIRIAQSEVEDVLAGVARERGCAVEWETELVGFAQSDDGVSAHCRKPDGTEDVIHCHWLVSCEGARGVAREVCAIPFENISPSPMRFLMADVELNGGLSPDTHHFWPHPEGALLAMPEDGLRRWRLLVDVTRQAADLPSDIAAGRLARIVRSRAEGASIEIGSVNWLSPLDLDHRIAKRFRDHRVLLAGDAAHFHSPTGGQGMALGLQDAANLAWKLARVVNGAPQRLLDTYDEERRAHARHALDEVHRTMMLFAAPDWPLRMLRDFITIPALRRAGLQQHMFEPFTHLQANYRSSRLSRHRDGRAFARLRVCAGDRAPDFALRRDTGELTSLFQLLGAGKPVVLIGPGELSRDENLLDPLLDMIDPLDVEAVLIAGEADSWWHAHDRCLIDLHGNMEHLYGLQAPFLCLIRPDDHIGLIQIPIDAAALREYLGEICPTRSLELTPGSVQGDRPDDRSGPTSADPAPGA